MAGLTTFRRKIRVALGAGTVTHFAPSKNQQLAAHSDAKLADCTRPPRSFSFLRRKVTKSHPDWRPPNADVLRGPVGRKSAGFHLLGWAAGRPHALGRFVEAAAGNETRRGIRLNRPGVILRTPCGPARVPAAAEPPDDTAPSGESPRLLPGQSRYLVQYLVVASSFSLHLAMLRSASLASLVAVVALWLVPDCPAESIELLRGRVAAGVDGDPQKDTPLAFLTSAGKRVRVAGDRFSNAQLRTRGSPTANGNSRESSSPTGVLKS